MILGNFLKSSYFFSAWIKGAGERRVALLFSIRGDRWRGRVPRSSSVQYSMKSKARESAAWLFCSVFAEIDGAGERRAALLFIIRGDRW